MRERSKEVGLDKVASEDLLIMKKFVTHVEDKCKAKKVGPTSRTKKVAKMYADRLSRILGFAQDAHPEKDPWYHLVDVEAARAFINKMIQAKYTSATILTYVKEALKCCKIADTRWCLLPDFPKDPDYGKLLKHTLLFWHDMQTDFNKTASEEKDHKLEVEEVPPMGPAFKYFADQRNAKLVEAALTELEEASKDKDQIHLYPGGADRNLNTL